MRFKMFGPYDIKDQRGHADWLDKEDFDHYWTHVVDADTHGLSTACGVYLFGVRGIDGKRKTVGKTLPWYVGKAERQPFRKECFNGRNQNEFNRIAFRSMAERAHHFCTSLHEPKKTEFFWHSECRIPRRIRRG